MNILIDDLRTVKEFNIRVCQECRFSNGGHVFAAVQGNTILLYSTYTFEQVGALKGHNARVRSITWGPNDYTLVSCGQDGAVYTWRVNDGERIGENVLKSCSYSCAALSPDGSSIFAVGSDQVLKEITDNNVAHAVHATPKTGSDVPQQVVLSHSGRMLIVGTSQGALRSLQFPLHAASEWTSYVCHFGEVTRLRISHDDQMLFSVGADGSLFMFKLSDKDGRGLKKEREVTFAEEILITKTDLDEKHKLTNELRTRVDELKMSAEYQLRLRDMHHNEILKESEHRYQQDLQSLTSQHQLLKSDKDKETNRHDQEVGALIDRHQREVQDLESSHTQKLMSEYEKFKDLQARAQSMQENYEKQLAAMEQAKTQAIQTITTQLEEKIAQKDHLLDQTKKESQEKQREFEEMRRQIELDADREILGIKNEYERQLKEEREAFVGVKGDNGILKKKFRTLQTDIEEHQQHKTDMETEQRKLHAHIRALEKDVQNCKKEIEERDETIQDKEKRIYDLKKKNQELEKFKFVLDYKIKELKKQLEPRELEIKDMKKQIGSMDKELEHYHQINTKLELQLTELKEKLQGSTQKVNQQQTETAKLKNALQRLRAELHAAAALVTEPKKLVVAIRQLYQKHCSEQSSDNTTPEDELHQEFSRQREFLERSVASLRKKLAKSAELHKEEQARVVQENVALLKEINDLRKELKQSNTKASHLKSTLASSQRLAQQRTQRGGGLAGTKTATQIMLGSSPTHEDPSALLATTFADMSSSLVRLNESQEAEQVERIITMQKEEIRRLRETINTLEKTSNNRPPSSGRLPVLPASTPA
eukprot:m.170017 g.170017  ORF g.170017 m.170017 type:complete len:822 (+) comp25134_c0_seq4:219-2684(+)